MKAMKFGAPWCGPCKMQDKILDELIAEGYDIEKVDIDKQEELAEKYEVMSIPATIIFDDEGNEITRFIGLTQKNKLIEALS